MATPTFWLSHDNECARANLTSGSTGPTIPVTGSDIVDDQKSTIFRFEFTTGARYVEASWLASGILGKVGAVALLKTNLVPGDVVRFTIRGEGPLFDILYQEDVELTNDPALGFDADFVYVLPQDVEASTVRATIIPGDSPISEVYDIGEFWAGPCFRPEHGISYEVTPVLADPSEISYSRGQQAIANTRARFRALNLQFPALKESEVFGTYGSTAVNLWDIFQRNGRTRKVLTGLVGDGDTFTDERSYLVNRTALFGLMDADLQPQPFDASAGERLYSLSMAVRETR